MKTKEKLEQRIIAFFRSNLEEIVKTMDQLLEGYRPYAYIELGRKFLMVCSQIQGDPRFHYMNQFQSIVNQSMADIKKRIDQVDEELATGILKPSKSFQDYDSQMIEYFKPLYSKFYAEIDQIQADLYANLTIKPENDFEFYLNKSRLLIKSKIDRNFTDEQEKLIKQYRSSMQKSDQENISTSLTLRQEMKLFDDYRLAIEYHLVDIEDKGWFNTARLYCDQWIKYLQKIAIFHAKHFREPLVQKIEKEITKIENWKMKIESKYDKSMKLDTNQMKLLNSTIKDMILSYKIQRKKLKQIEQDIKILKQIQNLI